MEELYINNQQNDSIPEGLEFNESYMAQAFEMYDAAKKSRKRRLFIWFWRSSLGFAGSCRNFLSVFITLRARMNQASSKKRQNSMHSLTTNNRLNLLLQPTENVISAATA